MTFAPQFTMTQHMLRQIIAIERSRGFLGAVRLKDEWISRLRDDIRVEDALASVQIEGSSLTLEHAFEVARNLPADPMSDLSDPELEFVNYLQTFDAVDSLNDDREAVLTKGDLLNVHRSIVKGVRGSQRMAGEFRKEDVKVGDVVGDQTVVHHQPPPWSTIENEVQSLLDWIERSKSKRKDLGAEDPWVHPAIVAGITQHRLVWIHPFLDGNGRAARMFTTLILFQRGHNFKYMFDLSQYYNADRNAYYEMLRTADQSGDCTEWLTYFLGGLSHQMMRIEDRAKAASRAERT